MIIATLVLNDPEDPRQAAEVEILLSPGYGSTADVAHEMLLICLAAEWPVVLDSTGDILYIPPGSLKTVSTRAA